MHRKKNTYTSFLPPKLTKDKINPPLLNLNKRKTTLFNTCNCQNSDRNKLNLNLQNASFEYI